MSSPGVASEYAAYGEVEAAERAVLLYGLDGILRTRRGEPARWRREGRYAVAVEVDGQQQQVFNGFGYVFDDVQMFVFFMDVFFVANCSSVA